MESAVEWLESSAGTRARLNNMFSGYAIKRFPPARQDRLKRTTTGVLRDGIHHSQPLETSTDREGVYWQALVEDQFVHLPGTRETSLDIMEPDFQMRSTHHACHYSKVDFHRILAKGGPEEYLCTLQHALECLACPLCEYISELTIGLKSGPLGDTSQDVECFVKRVTATADEFPQRTSTNPLARILLILRGRLRDGSFGVHATSFTLDCVPRGQFVPSSSGLCSLYRRPIERQFDPKLLREWLEKSIRSGTSRKQTECSQLDASFRQLVETGKFRVVDVLHRKIVSISRPVQFPALSYVWDRNMTNYAAVLSDTRENGEESDRDHSIDWLRLPRTVNDAIELTKSIRERYLWVDSLCIDQFNAEENGYLISQMVSLPCTPSCLACPEVAFSLL